jgi:hypothetical protein
LKAELEAKLRSFELQQQVPLLGSVPTERMPAIMAASDILFIPSQNEGISQAFYEALACGLVVVGAQVGGQGELVSPDCGILYSPIPGQDETAEYASILNGLIGDPSRRQQMSQAGRDRICAGFTLDRMGECFGKYLSGMIEIKKNIPIATTGVEKDLISREIQYLVEYFQVKRLYFQLLEDQQRLDRDFRDIHQKYLELTQPKPPSHWFYLWIRQLLLPVFTRFRQTKLMGLIDQFKRIIKGRLVKDS